MDGWMPGGYGVVPLQCRTRVQVPVGNIRRTGPTLHEGRNRRCFAVEKPGEPRRASGPRVARKEPPSLPALATDLGFSARGLHPAARGLDLAAKGPDRTARGPGTNASPIYWSTPHAPLVFLKPLVESVQSGKSPILGDVTLLQSGRHVLYRRGKRLSTVLQWHPNVRMSVCVSVMAFILHLELQSW